MPVVNGSFEQTGRISGGVTQTQTLTGTFGKATGCNTFIYEQVTPASVWTISHGRNNYPSVTCINATGDMLIGRVSYTSANILLVTFSENVSGKAYLN